jgi:2-dehydropantoate 2-reductase
MGDFRFAVVGIGATGTVLAASLISRDPETLLVGTGIGQGKALKENGIRVSGALSYEVPVRNYIHRIDNIKDFSPNVVFIATKTFHLETVLNSLKDNIGPDTKIISSHNGLGPEDRIAEYFGKDAAFRMSLNYGVSLKGFGKAEVAFFNGPNHLGALSDSNRDTGLQIAALLTDEGLFTEYIDDISLYVWKKMIMKCTMAPICAITGMTIKGALEFSPTREIAEACFKEAMNVARAMGYEMEADYMDQVMDYLNKVGMHKDSMHYDIVNKTPTEIDFLGGKIVEYALQKGIPTPFYVTMTNLVKAMEAGYLSERF